MEATMNELNGQVTVVVEKQIPVIAIAKGNVFVKNNLLNISIQGCIHSYCETKGIQQRIQVFDSSHSHEPMVVNRHVTPYLLTRQCPPHFLRRLIKPC